MLEWRSEQGIVAVFSRNNTLDKRQSSFESDRPRCCDRQAVSTQRLTELDTTSWYCVCARDNLRLVFHATYRFCFQSLTFSVAVFVFVVCPQFCSADTILDTRRSSVQCRTWNCWTPYSVFVTLIFRKQMFDACNAEVPLANSPYSDFGRQWCGQRNGPLLRISGR